VDDAQKFVAREIKRGVLYDGIVLDPPSYGRGTSQEMWKIETHLLPFLENLKKLLSPEFAYWQLSSHTPGYTPLSLMNLLGEFLPPNFHTSSFEMGIRESRSGGRTLPSGACALGFRSLK
jgi:23S rRNA (cytosine1962-C5)-methyltransferase